MNESLKIETNDNAELPLLINPDYSTTRFSVPPSSQRQTTRFSSERHISLTPQSSDRLASLDLFRGITIWFMCLVNHAGGSYEILEHALWNGLTIADFVMPFFLFIVGMAIALSFSKLKHGGQSRLSIFAKIIGRTAKLFFLGLIIQGWDFPFYDMYNIRIMGILQRIAIGYFIVSTVALFVPRTYLNDLSFVLLCDVCVTIRTDDDILMSFDVEKESENSNFDCTSSLLLSMARGVRSISSLSHSHFCC